jgi:hypothetical protein
MPTSSECYEKALSCLRSALQTEDQLERSRLIDETVRWRRLAGDNGCSEDAVGERRTFARE